MLGANDNETRSYLEIADAIRRYGASPAADLRQLWRRMLFNVLISNTDDHLRNHGFLYIEGAGWRLAPAYDLNPVPAWGEQVSDISAILASDQRALRHSAVLVDNLHSGIGNDRPRGVLNNANDSTSFCALRKRELL